MPLYKTLNPNSQTCVKIWKIAESYEELIGKSSLRPESLERLQGMKSELHQRGFLSVRHLLREFGYTDQDLYYDDHGKPHLKDGKHISITHSFNFSAVVVSDAIVGIDIEMQRDKITRIARKFIDYEFDYLDANHSEYVKKLTVIWCIKETLYKLYATPGLSFKQHTLVIPFTLDESNTSAWIDFDTKSKYMADFLEFEGFTCAYTLPA
ncbi:4'-phosphopantetheinyl transferase superfamily protein [Winogradskyella sp. 3972H.M.0a.05]|uniref:4'-phosphopantetheinyl transferase family protein n=1 Tax=Winogradskyella sp. 3972H.M.0a.05 TaxID=2950277 RepID=UPI0033964AA2